MIARRPSGLRNLQLNIDPPPDDDVLASIPDHFSPEDVLQIYSVDDNELGPMATEWARSQAISPAAADDFKVSVMLIDDQITFCNPDCSLFVTGDTGLGAAEDTVRTIRWIYQNARWITNIDTTLDTHYRNAIFHAAFWVDPQGNHPAPYTVITANDITSGRWDVSPDAVWSIARDMKYFVAFRRHCREYTRALEEKGRYPLIVWPYHARIGNIEHCLVPSLYEACEWHAVARGTEVGKELKGGDPLVEHYSAVAAEVEETCLVTTSRNTAFIKKLMEADWVIAAGQAASHCFAWTLKDMLDDPLCLGLSHKLIILEDCTSSVVVRDPSTGNVIPGSPENPTDFRPMAEQAFDDLRNRGVRFITTQTPIINIPGYGDKY